MSLWSSRPEIAYRCRCGNEATSGIDGRGRCRSCAAETVLALPPQDAQSRVIERCAACGGEQLYLQRDFNQKAGLAIVVAGALLAPFTPYYASLFAAALLDACLYAVVPEITICYRCHAHYRGFARNPRHMAFDLHLAEQYEAKTPGR